MFTGSGFSRGSIPKTRFKIGSIHVPSIGPSPTDATEALGDWGLVTVRFLTLLAFPVTVEQVRTRHAEMWQVHPRILYLIILLTGR